MKNKKIILTFISIFSILFFISLSSAIDVSSCGELNIDGGKYVLKSNVVTTGTCFNITADNVTLDGQGYNIDGDDAGTDYGIFASNRLNVTIKNINITDFSHGVYFDSVNSSVVNNATMTSTSLYGVETFNSYNNHITNISVSSSYAGVVINTGSHNNILRGVTLISNNDGLAISEANNNTIDDVTIDLTADESIQVTASNNTFSSIRINNSGKDAILISDTIGVFASNNIFSNVNITNTSKAYYDIEFRFVDGGGGINNTHIRDTYVENYTIGGTVIFRDSTFGEIRFLQAISGSGTNLSDDIRIGNNSVTVLSNNNAGLNKSANVTLYNLPTSFDGVIFRDGANCPAGICYNLTSLKAGTVVFNVSYWTNYSIRFYPKVTLVSPADGSLTTDRTPTFNWTGSDAEGDSLTYEINITCLAVAGGGCGGGDDNRYVQNIPNLNYTSTSELKYLYDNQYYYNWSVRANDSIGYGEWAVPRRINISALLSISLVNASINFGSLQPNITLNTTSGSPGPFVLQSSSNALINVSIEATNLWSATGAGNPSEYFMSKADNFTGHEGAFNWQKSLTDWFNISASGSPRILIAELNYTRLNRTEIDILIKVPATEHSATRNANVTFVASLGE